MASGRMKLEVTAAVVLLGLTIFLNESGLIRSSSISRLKLDRKQRSLDVSLPHSHRGLTR